MAFSTFSKAILGSICLICISVWVAVASYPDQNLHLWFCDVGQGDGLLIQKQFTQILVDVGGDGRMASCLSRHLPFYDRQIEMIISTHPQQDHLGGLPDVLKGYRVIQIVSLPISTQISSSKVLADHVEKQKSAITHIYTGDQINIAGINISTVWPTKDFVTNHSQSSPTSILGATTDGTDLNQLAIVVRLSFGEFDILLTGDADSQVAPAEIATGLLSIVEVLKVPHHGSKTGMTEPWLSLIKPQIAVISSGKNNSYGHPAPEALNLLAKFNVKVLRTDQLGDIEIVTDGKTYWVNHPK